MGMRRTVCLWVQGNGGCDHLKGGSFFSFLNLFFFSLCVTSIKTHKYGTRTNRHEGQLYLQPGWHLPTWPVACRGRGRGGRPRQSGEEMRQKKNRVKAERRPGGGEADLKHGRGDSPHRV